jgi:NADP-dependent aldehyde dehydrogenase
MELTGKMLIGQRAAAGSQPPVWGINPSTDERLDPPYAGGSSDEVEQACQLAWEAFDQFRETSLESRAKFLDTVASEVESLGDILIERAVAETGLPRARVVGERGRTCQQLRIFARTVLAGEWLDVRVDHPLPDRTPAPRPGLRQRQIPVGPVVVFGASNFPLAFSVAGGDTASAFAAGCPVIVKAHAAHPGTSELVGRAVQTAVQKCGLPEGVFSLLFGSGREIGQALVTDFRIKAVGFTGSRSGGISLLKAAQSRNEPIPVYAEMSSINPVFVFPSKLAESAAALASEFVTSLTQGAGQFCTNPGLVVLVKGPASEAFLKEAATLVMAAPSQTMLTPAIAAAYRDGIQRLRLTPKVEPIADGQSPVGNNCCVPQLFTTEASAFLANKEMQDEVFGASAMIVLCSNVAEFKTVAESLDGQLTCTLQISKGDHADAKSLLPTLERKAGRILVNSWPTGVEVCDSMVHGGPFPATSDSRTTSVGTAAINRFLRPVCYQNVPSDLLPVSIDEENSYRLNRLVEGSRELK